MGNLKERFIAFYVTMSDNKLKFGLIVFMALLMVVIGFNSMMIASKNDELETTLEEAESRADQAERGIIEREAELEALRTDSVTEATGLNTQMVADDAELAEEFFTPAFNWKNWEQYESMRQEYLKILGEDTSFATVYLPEDTIIETDDGDLAYIDHMSLMATMRHIHIVPTSVDSKTVRYVGFIEYITHRSEDDMANPDALIPSTAVVEFTVHGEGSERRVSQVVASPGFASETP